MRDRLPLILVAVLVLAGLAGLVLLRPSDEGRLNASVIGVDLLAPVLRASGLEVERSNPRIRPDIEELSLRILPLYDTDLAQEAREPATQRQAFYATTLRDVTLTDVAARHYDMPTLIMLPKWVAGTVTSEIAHESVLIPKAGLARLTGQLGVGNLRLRRDIHGMWQAPLEVTPGVRATLTLFEPQLFDAARLPDICKPELAVDAGVLLARCRWPQSGFDSFVLSDPDLLNNHGLTLGENATLAVALIRRLSGAADDGEKNMRATPLPAAERRIYIDTEGENLATWYDYDDERRAYDRDALDLARFFAPPFTALWAMLLIVLGIAFWRGSLRFGPARPAALDTPEQSKTAAIATNARLLRIAGHDARMVADLVQANLTDLAQTTFGRAAGAGAQGRARLFAHLARRDAAATAELQAVAARLTDPEHHLPPQDLRRHLDTFRRLLERLTHVPG